MDRKILIVDDEPDIRKLLVYNFEKEGYRTFEAENGEKALLIAEKEIPHVILLDVMLPDIDGIEVCEKLRNKPPLDNAHIIFLSARGEDYSQVAGYQAGGDDYIIKPVKMRVLTHKVNAIIERMTERTIRTSNKFQLDAERYSIIKDGVESIIPKKEFELLSFLANSPNKVFRRNEILTEVWGNHQISDRTIDVHVRKLREKFGQGIVKTIKGVGYRFSG